MTTNLKAKLTAGVVVLGTAAAAQAQYAPPPPLQPFPGFINEAWRKSDPYASNWDIGGLTRLRYEVRENNLAAPPANDFRAGFDNDNSFLAEKTLFRVAHTQKWWSVYLEGRNSAVTGDDRGAAPNIVPGSSPDSDGPLDLHQAYVTLGNHKEFPLSLTVGRQELSYGDERLVGGFAWNNIGRVFDSGKVRWQNSWFNAEAFTGRIVVPDDNEFNTPNDYEVFSGLHLSSRKIPKVITEAYVFARNASAQAAAFKAPAITPAPFNTSARDIYTIGTRFRSATNEWSNFDFTLEGAGQFGNWKRPGTAAVNPGQRDEHQAFAVTLNAGYTFADSFGTPRVALEYNYASGDSNPNDGTHGTFDNLFPTNHKFYGYMDLIGWQNVHNPRVIYQMRPHPRVSFAVEGHAFWLADTADSFYNVAGIPRATAGAAAGSGRGYAINPTYDSFIGTEIDLVVGITLTRFAALELGYAHFFRGSYVKDSWAAIGSRDADWVYAQTVIRF